MRTEVETLASSVERMFDESGIRLTMGAEPTFVPDSPSGPEWNNEALGDEKLRLARAMATVLEKTVYPEALICQTFGKWYPGEILPRWNILLVHSREGHPLWSDQHRLSLSTEPGTAPPDSDRDLIHRIADRLELEGFVLEAIEEAQRDRRSGWVLPLDHSDGRWFSEDWSSHLGASLELFSGDSPVGLRLPLGSLPDDSLRRAFTIERREGRLELFIPPLAAAPFRELIGIIEDLVRASDLTDLLFCGYLPTDSGDAFDIIGMAADPGVLEVNLPPRDTWTGYREVLLATIAAADDVGLRMSKTALNGIVNGSGGGCHLCFGGPALEENPFLKDPSRIASILRYWQQHPALSYFFSGRYVGPGSQAPRVDEGPTHGLYELEVACEGLETIRGELHGTTVDQFLRNLMTDSSGNTHRAEICFDKFHNPLAPNGRLGIVEFRAFETLPDGEALATAALFFRTVIARLFKAPCREALRRFGPELHDRFFLPSFLWADLGWICNDLAEQGFPFALDWLEPWFDFRFPVHGILPLPGGSRLMVRQALESWPLMAEESRGSSTVRVVDNSTDRLEVALEGPASDDSGDCALVVNGILIPLHPVGERRIAGIRYKCASAYPALHPHVPIQSPLSIEWINTRSQEVLAAANYHYWEPSGSIYPGRPETPQEASRRRVERWGLTPWRVGTTIPSARPRISPEFNCTVDLRRQGVGAV